MTRRVLLAVNPTSGKGRGRRVGDAVERRLTANGLEVVRVQGRDGPDAARRVGAALTAGADALVVVGGDGMAHLGVNAVGGTDVPLGVVPAGTGNDFARALGLGTAGVDAAVGAVLTGRSRLVDLGRCTPSTGPDGARWFGGVVAAGFDSRVNDRANRMRWPPGRLRYDLAMLVELGVFHPLPYELVLDGERWITDAMLVAVGNGASYGGGMLVCPGARIDDGELDITLLLPMRKGEFIRVFPRVFKGTHVEHPAVVTRRARTISLTCPATTAYADGEVLASLPVELAAVPGALRVLAP